MPDLRVVIVADDPLARAGLAVLLSSVPGATVVGQMAGTADLLAGLEVYRPDIVLWDLGWEPERMPTGSRPSVLSERGEPKTPLERLVDLRDTGYPVVVLLPDDTHAAIAWAAGVRGLVLREVTAEMLVTALQAATRGLIVFDAALAASFMPTRAVVSTPLAEALTPRELDVLRLVAEGLPNKTIADRLHISEHTVKFHLNALMGKLGAQSRTDAVVRATRLGILLL